MNLLKKKNFRYGSIAALLSVVLIAVIIAANVIVSALSAKFNWAFDMTSENLFEVSETSKKLLSEVDLKNRVTIYFLTDEDRLTQGVTSANYYGQSGLWGMRPIYELAKELAEENSYITVDHIDLTREPRKVRNIVGDDYDRTRLSETSIIIDNYTEYVDASGAIYDSNHNYRVYARDSFYTYSYSNASVSSFLGDYRFCSAIRSITLTQGSEPVAYFLSGHGESIGSYDRLDEDSKTSIDYGSAQALWQVFRDSGYEIRKIDLRYENFEGDRDGVAVIYAPVSDYINESTSEQFNEIAKLDNFVASGNSIMAYIDPKESTLTNLEGFLKDRAGVGFKTLKLKDNGENSVSIDGYSLIGQAVGGSDIIDGLSAFYTDGEKTIFNSARPLEIDPSKAVTLYSVPDSITNDGYTAGSDGLLAISEQQGGGYIFCSGTSLFVNAYYMDSDIYANHDVVLRALDKMNDSDRVSFGIPVKVIRDEGLDLTNRQANLLSVAVTLSIPFVFAVLGTIVYVRRRHS